MQPRLLKSLNALRILSCPVSKQRAHYGRVQTYCCKSIAERIFTRLLYMEVNSAKASSCSYNCTVVDKTRSKRFERPHFKNYLLPARLS